VHHPVSRLPAPTIINPALNEATAAYPASARLVLSSSPEPGSLASLPPGYVPLHPAQMPRRNEIVAGAPVVAGRRPLRVGLGSTGLGGPVGAEYHHVDADSLGLEPHGFKGEQCPRSLIEDQ
jgi:hypothetical protein